MPKIMSARIVECSECDGEFDLNAPRNWKSDTHTKCPHCGNVTHGAAFAPDQTPREYWVE